MSCHVSLQLDRETVCLSDLVQGVVTVTVGSATTSAEGGTGAPTAVRVLIRGVENCGKQKLVEHVVYVRTVAGQLAPSERDDTAAVHREIAHYVTEGARSHPLPGVAISDNYHLYGGPQEARYYSDSAMVVRAETEAAAATAAASARARSSPAPPTHALDATAPAPLTWVAGERYEYRFSIQLPPWLPPTYFHKIAKGTPHTSMRYVATAFVVMPTPVKPETRRLATAVLTPAPTKSSRKSEKDTAAPQQVTLFDLPREAAQLVQRVAPDQVKEFIALSALPKRELQQCTERSVIPPPFCQNLVYHVYKHNPLLAVLGRAPYTSIDIRISFNSSAAIMLSGQRASQARGYAALGLAMPRSKTAAHGDNAAAAAPRRESATLPDASETPGGLTVTGRVVHREQAHSREDARSVSSSDGGSLGNTSDSDGDTGPSRNELRQLAKRKDLSVSGYLRLRMRVHTGSISVDKIRVKLIERVRGTGATADAQKHHAYKLASYTYRKPIRANETVDFPVYLRLPKRFRHTIEDGRKYPPPAGITTAAIQTATWLSITFPGLHAIPEKLLDENVVIVAEDVDLTDTVPFLPRKCVSRAVTQPQKHL